MACKLFLWLMPIQERICCNKEMKIIGYGNDFSCKHVSALQEFLFSFLLSSRLFLRPHELLGKLLDAVPDIQGLETLVALLAEWTQKFPYDYRDERMMNHVKHIVVR